MNDLNRKMIYLDDTLKALRPIMRKSDYYYEIQKAIQDIPSAQPERKTGKWNRDADGLVWCNTCGFGKERSDDRVYRFCPNCGTKMEEGENE